MALTNTRYKYGFGYKAPTPPAPKSSAAPVDVAAQTWTPQNRQNLANAYSALNPAWSPPASSNAALPQPISPVTFDPSLDPSYAAAEGTYGYTDAQGYHPGSLVQHAQTQADFLGHQYGQQYGYDQQGNLITAGADLNPYAQAAILKRNYDNSVRGTTNSYAAQGQLYAGSLTNAQNANDFNYGTASDQLKRTAQGAYNAAGQSVTNARDTSLAQLSALVGPAYANFLAGQKGP